MIVLGLTVSEKYQLPDVQHGTDEAVRRFHLGSRISVPRILFPRTASPADLFRHLFTFFR